MARKRIYETHTKPLPVWWISRHEQDQQLINHFILDSELSRTRYQSKWLNAGLEDNINDNGLGNFDFFVVTVYRASQEKWTKLRESIPYVKIYRYNPKHLCPKLNGYVDKGQKKVWSSCGSTCCTWFAWRNTHTLRIVRPCLQPAQARSSLRLHM